MPNPYADDSIIMDATTSDPTEYLQFDPDGLPEDRWLHRRDQFDATADEEAIRDEYALPRSDTITVTIVDVPADVGIRIGTIGALHGQTGGADLVELREFESVPSSWVRDSLPLDAMLEGE